MRETTLWRNIGYGVVICAFAAALGVLIPWGENVRRDVWETRQHTYDFPPMTKEQALKEITEATRLTLTEVPHLSADRVYQNFKLVNLFLTAPFNELKKDPAVNATIKHLGRLNVNTLDAQDNRLQIRNEINKRRSTDPEFLAIDSPQETIWYWNVLGAHATSMLPFSFTFVVIGLIGLLRLWGFAKLVNVGGCTVSFFLSVAGGAIAQTAKKAEGKKGGEKTTQTLQVDVRASLFVTEGPPNPNLFLRLTNITPKTLVESVSTWNPRNKNWSTDAVAGIWIPKTGKTKMLAMGVIADDRASRTRVGLGTQIYRPSKWGFLAIPVARWESNSTGPPQHSFAVIANPNVRIGLKRWSIAPDVGTKKMQGRPWNWSIGAALRFSPEGSKHQYEIALMGNSAGVLWLRPRVLAAVPH